MFSLPSSLLLWILSMYIYTNVKLQWIKTIKQIWDLQFSQHCFWQVRSSVMGAVSLGAWFFCDFMTLEDEGTTFLWNIAKHSPNDRASDPRWPESSIKQLFKKWYLCNSNVTMHMWYLEPVPLQQLYCDILQHNQTPSSCYNRWVTPKIQMKLLPKKAKWSSRTAIVSILAQF